MKLTVIAVGRIRPPFDAAEAHYLKLLKARQKVEVIEVKEDEAMLRRVAPDSHVVSLGLDGKAMDSIAWSSWLDARRLAARDVVLLIGGPEGLGDAARERSNETLSLGPQTMAHQLARIVLLEQLFRAGKILAGEKYHL
ncbi:MAG: 23S rRNA (pseudouridine(1915)-N(3))-methyltransferase RlmH [Solirubrobacterales bacterium]